MSSYVGDNSTPTEQACGIIGEHFENYIVVCQNPELPNCIEIHTPNPVASVGLLAMAIDWSRKQNSLDDDTSYFYEWEETESEEDEGEALS